MLLLLPSHLGEELDGVAQNFVLVSWSQLCGSCLSSVHHHLTCNADHHVAVVGSFADLSNFEGATLQVLTGGSLAQPAGACRGGERRAGVCPPSVLCPRPARGALWSAWKLLGRGTRSSVAPKQGLGSLKACFFPHIGIS